jgi:hypothetical protein
MAEKVEVVIYCKVGTDCFGEHNDRMTGQEIYDFLMSDVGYTYEEADESLPIWKDPPRIPGDLRIWYLGCNEKMGTLRVENEVWEWRIGDSNFDRVQEFIDCLDRRGLFTKKQYYTLCEKIIEGRKINWMYDIRDYLKAKAQGKPWKGDPEKGREESRKFFGCAFRGMEKLGYEVHPTTETHHTVFSKKDK